MVENVEKSEIPLPKFIEKKVNETTDSDRCVDGRQDNNSNQGYQLLGGDAHPIVLNAIQNNTVYDSGKITNGLNTLKENGIPIGFHRGSHADLENGKCDCGFCDRLTEIILTAKDKKDYIIQQLKLVFDKYKDHLPNFSIIEKAYEKIIDFDINNVQIVGDDAIKIAEKSGANIENLEGSHAERQAFVNLKLGVTLDTKAMNDQGEQAFNLDLPAAVKRSEMLGVEKEFAIGASLILYTATEIVLVENKGKPALPVVLHT